MARGQFQFSGNLDVKASAALDARMVVATKADLIKKETWPSDGDTLYLYKGLIVSVNEDDSLWMLINPEDALNSSYAAWKQIDSNAAEKTTIVDSLDSDSTTSALSAKQGKVLKGLIDSNKQEYDNFVATKGQANGLASLNENGKIPASQLDGTLGRVQGIEKFLNTQEELNIDSSASQAKEGDKYFCKDVKKIFTKTSSGWDEGISPVGDTIYNHRLADAEGRTNILYRWDGSEMVEISASLALGETEGTAYEGSKGKANADAIKALQNKDLAIDAYTVNGIKISENPILSGNNINITEYVKPGAGGALAASDTVNAALGKLEFDLDKAEEELVKISGEGAGSISEKIKEAIEALKGGASENFDTLKELEDAIKNNDIKSLTYDQGTRVLTLTKNNNATVTVELPEATSDLPGLMSKDDKAALDKAVQDITNIQNQVTTNKVEAADKSVVVTPSEGQKTTIKVNVKSGDNALKLDAENGLYVDQSALTSYEGKEAIAIADKAESEGVKEISLKINANDKVLTQAAEGLLANINLTWSTADGLKLIGKNSTEIASIPASDFIKDGMLQSVELKVASEDEPIGEATTGTFLVFTFNVDAGSKVINVNVTDLIDVYTASTGIKLEGKNFIAVIDPASEAFLTVGADGIKLSGVQNAINAAKATVDAYTVNAKAISSNPVLSGADITLTGYSTVEGGAVAATDTINQAINKLDDALIWHEA